MILIVTLVLISYVLRKAVKILLPRYTSPIRLLPGPKGLSWIAGNMREIRYTEDLELYEWLKQYGPTFTYKGFFSTNQLLTTDSRAINHILNNNVLNYQKPSFVRFYFKQFFGEGLLTAEAPKHRAMKRVLNPAFGPAQIRALSEVFLAHARRLRDVMMADLTKDPKEAANGGRRDIVPWMNNVTLDIIGLTGFGYNFNALEASGADELHDAFSTLHSATEVNSIFPFLQAWLPALRIFASERDRKIQAARRTTARISKELVSRAKEAARSGVIAKDDNGLNGRDLLSLLVKANMSTDIPEHQRLSDEDVLSQVPTFVFAGHGTTSASIAWGLHSMTHDTAIQDKLREELLAVDSENPTMDEINALPYLDAVVREILRLHAPLPISARIAMNDDVLPLERPVTDINGVVRDSIPIRAGDPILIPMLAINCSREIWGPDSHEFKPERWQNLPEAVSRIPGVWSNIMTFMGGVRACIGWRFSVIEIKFFLFVLVRAFEFAPAVPANEVGARWTVAHRPILRAERDKGPQLPMLMKPYRRPSEVEA